MALGKRAWRWRKRAWRGAIVKVARGNTRLLWNCYEMDKTGISIFEILEPGGQLWANTAFEGSQFYSIGVPKFYSWVNVISVYVYNDLG